MLKVILADLIAMTIWEIGKMVVDVYIEIREERKDLQISKV